MPISNPTQRGSVQVALAGAGVFGRNHLRVYQELVDSGYPVVLSAIVESDAVARLKLRDESGVAVFDCLDACLAAKDRGELQIDAASVCVPTSAHFEVASALLDRGIDVLIEKPIATSLAEADGLVELAGRRGCVLQVGHLERFNPAVIAIQPHLNRPMFFEAHRLSVFTPRSLDVDVVLDLMIHDLDIVLSIDRSPIRDVRAVGLPILSSKVDIANVRIEFESGCVANFTASRVSTERVRKLRFFQPHQYVSIDYARKDLLVIDVSAAAGDHSGAAPGLLFSKPAVGDGEPLRLEIESFLSCVRDRSTPLVTGADGRLALAVALQIHGAMSAHSKRAGLEGFHL
ncbi:MAG TPA: Gfo/Idh/MocA family oxidoreductase [Acidisarcina sp.]